MAADPIRVYHNPRCSKSRQCLVLLDEKGMAYREMRYLDNPPSEAELRELLKMLGMRAEELVRKNEDIYKSEFKGKELSEDEWIAALHRYPKLIERPIVVYKGKAVVARPPEKAETLLND